MSNYKYDNLDEAYQEALRRIKKAQDIAVTKLDLVRLGLKTVLPEIGKLTMLAA